MHNWRTVSSVRKGKSLSTYFNKSVKYTVQYFMWGNGRGRGRMQLGWWELLGASFPLFSSRPFLSMPGCLQVLDQQLPSLQPTQEEQLAEACICVAQPAPAGFLQPQEAQLLGREGSRAMARAEVRDHEPAFPLDWAAPTGETAPVNNYPSSSHRNGTGYHSCGCFQKISAEGQLHLWDSGLIYSFRNQYRRQKVPFWRLQAFSTRSRVLKSVASVICNLNHLLQQITMK